MAINKVVLHNDDGTEKTLVDLTGDTVAPETLMQGVTAHDKAGEPIVGIKRDVRIRSTGVNYVKNGYYTVRANEGEAFRSVDVHVDVPTPEPPPVVARDLNVSITNPAQNNGEYTSYYPPNGEYYGAVHVKVKIPLPVPVKFANTTTVLVSNTRPGENLTVPLPVSSYNKMCIIACPHESLGSFPGDKGVVYGLSKHFSSSQNYSTLLVFETNDFGNIVASTRSINLKGSSLIIERFSSLKIAYDFTITYN